MEEKEMRDNVERKTKEQYMFNQMYLSPDQI